VTIAANAVMPARQTAGPASDLSAFFQTLTGFATPLAIKLYRLRVEPALALPTLPCLDHEAMLHEGIPPHAAAYVQDSGGDLHEVVFIPDRRHIDVDVVSTMGECSDAAHERFVATLKERFPDFRVRVVRASWLKGDRRVANACRAQVALRDVLTGTDIERTKAAVDRL